MNSKILYWAVSGALAATLACASGEADDWVQLFDGTDLSGWHGYNGGSLDAWTVEDGAIKSLGTEGNYGEDTRTDLVTDGQYTNFELSVDWKASAGGNSGIMYGVIEDPKYEASWMTGPEYQLVDDSEAAEDVRDVNKTAADYDMSAPAADKPLNPVGEWNTSRIVVNDNHVEHWLNGVKVLEFERWNDAWEALKNGSKWKDYPDYGSAATGHIVLQDHGSVFWFRNVKIREITDE